MSENTKKTAEEPYYGTPQPVAGLRGVKMIRRKYRGTVFIANLTSNAGALHLGTFTTVEEASARYDVCKRLFLILIGDAARLVERSQYNDPVTAFELRNADDCRKLLGAKLTARVESLASSIISGNRRQDWAPKITRQDFAERLKIVEGKLDRALAEIELLRRRSAETKTEGL